MTRRIASPVEKLEVATKNEPIVVVLPAVSKRKGPTVVVIRGVGDQTNYGPDDPWLEQGIDDPRCEYEGRY